MKQKVGIIGGGNMGAAIINGIYKKYKIAVCEPVAKRRTFLQRKFKVTIKDLFSLITESNVIVLAVKPQDMDPLLNCIRPLLKKRQLVISIAAGVTTKFLERRLGKGIKIIRTMPNLPAQVKEGMTAIAPGKYATRADAKKAERLFQNIGPTVIVDEKWLDAVTAVSGSGPAYVFLFVESFIQAAQSTGLNRNLSELLVMQTLQGSLKLLTASKEDAKTLRTRVTSKGGTTHAALQVFFKKQFPNQFKTALKAARKRAKELSKG